MPIETNLEETYFHRINPSQGYVFQRVYTDDRSLDEAMAAENNDVVMVPKGYHPRYRTARLRLVLPQCHGWSETPLGVQERSGA